MLRHIISYLIIAIITGMRRYIAQGFKFIFLTINIEHNFMQTLDIFLFSLENSYLGCVSIS